MKVVQILPALYGGGVETGTVDFAAELVRRGHQSYVISSGGPMVQDLESSGSIHFRLDIHRKRPSSLKQVRPLRALIRELAPDVVHVRSRMPAWLTHLALRKIPSHCRPALVSTFHGMHSVNFYSAIMARADHVIAVSHCVARYIRENYSLPEQRLSVIERGVDVNAFYPAPPSEAWLGEFEKQWPQLKGKPLIMMPGRLSRWKGQLAFLEVMARIQRLRPDCHGMIVGGPEPGNYIRELEARRVELGLESRVHFLGRRYDMAELYRRSSVVCHLSSKPEPFGRTVTEALACGTPVVAFQRGGAAETLEACFREGLVPPEDLESFSERILALTEGSRPPIDLPERFCLKAQAERTLAIYHKLLEG